LEDNKNIKKNRLTEGEINGKIVEVYESEKEELEEKLESEKDS